MIGQAVLPRNSFTSFLDHCTWVNKVQSQLRQVRLPVAVSKNEPVLTPARGPERAAEMEGVFHLQKHSEISHWEFPFGKSAFHLS